MKIISSMIMLFLIVVSCKSHTENETIYRVSQEVIESIQNKDVEKFKTLIGNDKVKKDTELISFNVSMIGDLFKEYYNNRKPLIEITDRYNFLGQKCVMIPIYEDKKDSSVSELHLNLLFGPSIFFPMDKITGYKLVNNNEDSVDFKPYSYWKEKGIAK